MELRDCSKGYKIGRALNDPIAVVIAVRLLTFLRATAGRLNGRGISSLMAGLSRLSRCAASATGILPQIDGSGHLRAAEAVG